MALVSSPVAAFAHLNAEKSALYRAILQVFVSERARFTIALRPPEIIVGLAAQYVADPGSSPSASESELTAALDQLVAWNNLLATRDTADVATQRDVFVCENPTIVALAAARIGQGCAPLVCVNGQFGTPSLVLLRQLREAGARLRYHGDFDPAGLVIARRAMAEGMALPWRFGAQDYVVAPKSVPFSGEPGPTPWDPALSDAMRLDRRTVHEEAVFGSLAEDLAGNRHARV